MCRSGGVAHSMTRRGGRLSVRPVFDASAQRTVPPDGRVMGHHGAGGRPRLSVHVDTTGCAHEDGRTAMTVQRMDNVGIVVESLDAAISFFAELGLELEGRAEI